LDDTDGFENGIAEVEDKESQHEWNCIATIEEGIDGHDTSINKKFEDYGKQEGIDEFNKFFIGGSKQIIEGDERGGNEEYEKERNCR